MKKILPAVVGLLLAGQVAAAEPALDELKAAAGKGNAVAQNNLAVRYATGSGVGQDYREAARWYEKAGEQGHAIAQHNLGALYEQGLGVPKDPAAAAVWYALAAEQGDAWAQLSLGRLLVSGGNMAPDLVSGYKWVYIAAGSADPEVKKAASELLKQLAPTMKPEQLRQAGLLVRAWRPGGN